MIAFILLLRAVYRCVCLDKLDPITVLNALLSKEPYSRLALLLINHSLKSPHAVSLVRALLTRQLVDVNCRLNGQGWTMAHYAAYEKNLPLMRMLLRHDVDLALQDCNGNTALHLAIQAAQKRRLSQCNYNDLSEYEVNDQKALLNIIKLILEKDEEYDELLKIAFSQNFIIDSEINLTKNLDDKMNLVNKQNFFGKTALHYAIFLKPNKLSMKLIEILLQAKANPDQIDFRNCTPLFYLLAEQKLFFKKSPFIDLLINFKCDRLNLDEIDLKVSTLQQLCRKSLQKNFKTLCQFLIKYEDKLPKVLFNYLSKRAL